MMGPQFSFEIDTRENLIYWQNRVDTIGKFMSFDGGVSWSKFQSVM